jgi:hypothetical protein
MPTRKVSPKQIAAVRAMVRAIASPAQKLKTNNRLALQLTDAIHAQSPSQIKAVLAKAGLKKAKVALRARRAAAAKQQQTTVTIGISVHVPGTNYNIEGSFSFTITKKSS